MIRRFSFRAMFSFFVLVVATSAMLVNPQSAHAEGQLIPAENRKDMVHDPVRNLLYITNSDEVLRYDLSSGEFLSPFVLGGDLYGIDISPDGSYLVVADDTYDGTWDESNARAWIHLVNLETGIAFRRTYPREEWEGGSYSVAFGADGAILVASKFAGLSGYVPLRLHMFGTGATTILDRNVKENTMVSASADHSVIAFAEADSTAGYWGRYRIADRNYLNVGFTSGTDSFNYEIAVNRDATAYAIPVYYDGTKLYGADLRFTEDLSVKATGVAFDPITDALHVAVVGTSFLRTYDLDTMTMIQQFDLETTLSWIENKAYKEGRVKSSDDGKTLFVTVPGGVRVLSTALQLRGQVASDVDSMPLEGADVEIWRYDEALSTWSLETSTTAGPSGGWNIFLEDTAPRRVRIADPSGAHEGAWYGGVDVDSATDVTPGPYPDSLHTTLELLHPGGITGVVTGNLSGLALADVQVTLYGAQNEESIAVIATSDEGTFVFPGLAPGRYHVGYREISNMHAAEFAYNKTTLASADELIVSAENTITADAVLTFQPMVSGSVTDIGSGRPIAGAHVVLFDANEAWSSNVAPVASAVTDANGEYAIYGLDEQLYIVAFCDTKDVYRDIVWPGTGLPIDQSYAVMATPTTTGVNGRMFTIQRLLDSRVQRISGQSRYETGIEISKRTFDGADTAVIVNGDRFPDALSAAPLAGAYDAPILLVRSSSLPYGLTDELDRLGVKKIIIVGGTSVVTPAVEELLAEAGYGDITRVAGANRYETSAKVAEAVVSKTETRLAPFICRGDTFPDALSVAPFAYMESRPILLVRPDQVDPAVGASWNRFASQCDDTVILVGGSTSINDEVLYQLMEYANIEEILYLRLAGTTRYDTCAEVIRAYGWNFDVLGVASGTNYPDALSGGAACGFMDAPVVLTPPSGLAPASASILEENGLYNLQVRVLGGEGAVFPGVLTQIENALDDHVYDMDTYTSAVAGASTPMASHLHDSSAVGNGDKVPVDRPSIDFGSLEMLRQR